MVNRELAQWPVPVVEGVELPRVGGVSSFGAGGSNAHVLLQEYQTPQQQVETELEQGVMIVLSAKSSAQLQQQAQQLEQFISQQTEPLDLASVAYTLQLGREAMMYRLGVVVCSVQQLQQSLQQFTSGEISLAGMHQGVVEPKNNSLQIIEQDPDMQQALQQWLTQHKLDKLLQLWVKGLRIDWQQLYQQSQARRISLPTYPFAEDQYWIDSLSGESAVTTGLNRTSQTSIDQVFEQLEQQQIATVDAVQLLKALS